MTPRLQTPRLLLLPLALEDAPAIQRVFPRWEIVRYMVLPPWPYPPDGALAFVRDLALPAVARGEEWLWTLRLRTAPEALIGLIHLLAPKNAEMDNRGFWMDPTHQGQGLMTEAADAVLDFWFNTLGFPRLRTSKAVPNRASSRITEKQGMRLVDRTERRYIGGRFATEIWEITREEWNTRTGGDTSTRHAEAHRDTGDP